MQCRNNQRYFTYDRAAGHPADDHGSLQHAGHELDAVGQTVANQSVQSREYLGEQSLRGI